MLSPKVAVNSTRTATNKVLAIADPFRNAYGYSTKNSADLALANPPATPGGYNPTFDLWSTSDADQRGNIPRAAWITNW